MFVMCLETFGKTLLVLLAFRTCSQETSHPLLKGREGEREHPELSPPPGSQSSKGDLRRASLTKNEVRPVYEVYRPYGVVQDRAWRPNRNACETFTYYVCSRGTSEKSEIYRYAENMCHEQPVISTTLGNELTTGRDRMAVGVRLIWLHPDEASIQAASINLLYFCSLFSCLGCDYASQFPHKTGCCVHLTLRGESTDVLHSPRGH